MNNDAGSTNTREHETLQTGSLMKVLAFTAEKTKELADANSVLGDPIQTDGMTIIPVSKLSVGFAGGGADVSDAVRKKRQNPAGAGAKITLTPMTFLVISDSQVRLVSIGGENRSLPISDIITAVIKQARSLFESSKKGKSPKD